MLGPGVSTLDKLIQNGHRETFDFAFIDADKENNRNYYERCLVLVRKGGLICNDNVLWGGYKHMFIRLFIWRVFSF